jgi:hypothetical protein
VPISSIHVPDEALQVEGEYGGQVLEIAPPFRLS